MSQKAVLIDDSKLDYIPTPYDFAAVYARRSSPKDSQSIDTQVKLANELALEKNLIIYDVYKDEASATGDFQETRPEFSRLIEDAKDNKFKSIIVFRRDRLSRNSRDFIFIRSIFTEKDIKVHFTDTSEFISDGSPFSGLIENLIIGMAQLEAETTRGRVEPGRENKRNKGEYHSPKPLFIHKKNDVKIHPDKIRFELKNDEVAPLVTAMVEAYIQAGKTDDTVNSIFKEITTRYWDKENSKSKEGYKTCIPLLKSATIAGLQRKDRKKEILDTFVFDEKTGLYAIDKTMYQNFKNAQGAVAPELWYKAITIWRNNYKPRHKPSQDYLFKNLLFCNECKSEVRLIDDIYICKKKCFSVAPDKLLPPLLKRVISDLITSNKIQEYIDDKLKSLKKKRADIDTNMRLAKNNQRSEVKYIIENNLGIEDNVKLKKAAKEYSDLSKEKSEVTSLINNLSSSNTVIEKVLQDKDLAIDILLVEDDVKYVQRLLSSILEKVVIVGSTPIKFIYKS